MVDLLATVHGWFTKFDFPFGAAAEEKFDASQYAFFGSDVVEEVELGGLEDAEDGLPLVGFDDEEYQLGREEVAFLTFDYFHLCF